MGELGMENVTLTIPSHNDVIRSYSEGSAPASRRLAALRKSALHGTIHVVHNRGAAGDLEQHLEVDEKNEKLVFKMDACIQKTSKITEGKIEERRKTLKNMFGTPCQKWRDRRKFPFKLTLQLLKVLIVTLQLTTFHGERSTFDEFRKTNTDTFRKLFLKGDLDESHRGVIYTPEDLYDHINHVIYQYYRYDELSMSNRLTRNHSAAIEMHVTYFNRLRYDPSRQTYVVDPREDDGHKYNIPDIKEENCTEVHCYDIKSHLNGTNQSLELSKLIELDLVIYLGGIYVKVIDSSIEQPIDDVECVDFKITVTAYKSTTFSGGNGNVEVPISQNLVSLRKAFGVKQTAEGFGAQINYENKNSGGQLWVSLGTQLDVVNCKHSADVEKAAVRHNHTSKVALTAFDIFVMVVCLASGILAIRTIIRRYQQLKETDSLFDEHYGVKLSLSECLDFVSLWYFFYILSDIMVITASSLKLYIRYGAIRDAKTFTNEAFYDATGIMFGVASISEWISLIRYLGYASQYYILILTISNAIPALLRFITCSFVIFMGYVLAGWVALGPYDDKYATFSGTMQGLFALIHGDDVYATMNAIKKEDAPSGIWVAGQIFHYSYCILSIFAIANLFIAVIMDSYETIKKWKEEGMPKSFLYHFTDGTLNIVDEEPKSKDNTDNDNDGCMGLLSPFHGCFNCKRGLENEDGEEMSETVTHNGRHIRSDQ